MLTPVWEATAASPTPLYYGVVVQSFKLGHAYTGLGTQRDQSPLIGICHSSCLAPRSDLDKDVRRSSCPSHRVRGLMWRFATISDVRNIKAFQSDGTLASLHLVYRRRIIPVSIFVIWRRSVPVALSKTMILIRRSLDCIPCGSWLVMKGVCGTMHVMSVPDSPRTTVFMSDFNARLLMIFAFLG
ncbi:hypothetical protein BDR04DRAFT_1111716 [Suillus decipiens]|nr:hypothetical protein BDR04DRAFT_1111734 [Suillus decipiens]KAG2063259.1 hypothetical protein BDR04DRAFT_1111716 [Suillus decipiens]